MNHYVGTYKFTAPAAAFQQEEQVLEEDSFGLGRQQDFL